jgi:hypothetical protein
MERDAILEQMTCALMEYVEKLVVIGSLIQTQLKINVENVI